MKTSYPQIAQITRTVETEVYLWISKGFQTDAPKPYLPNLCNLRNLRMESVEGKL